MLHLIGGLILIGEGAQYCRGATAIPERPSASSYRKVIAPPSFKQKRPILNATTVDPNKGSPLSITGTGLLLPMGSTNMPLRPLVSVAKNATSSKLLIDTLSTDEKNELFVLGVRPRGFAVKTAIPPAFRKAAPPTLPLLLITGSRKPPKSGLFVSIRSWRALSLRKTPSLPSARNP